MGALQKAEDRVAMAENSLARARDEKDLALEIRVVDSLIEVVFIWQWHTVPLIHLKYTGEGHTEADIRNDMLAIADARGVVSGFVKRIYGGGDHRPHLEYVGLGEIKGRQMRITVETEILPKGCVVYRNSRRTWSTNSNWSVSCLR